MVARGESEALLGAMARRIKSVSLAAPATYRPVNQMRMLDKLPLPAEAQPATGLTYAHKIEKQEALIDWSKDAQALDRHIRAFNPFPGAQAQYGGQTVKLWRAEPVVGADSAPEAGLEREDAQSSPQPAPSVRGMWSDGTPDTSGYGEISRPVYRPTSSPRPLPDGHEQVIARLETLVDDAFADVLFDRGELTAFVPRERLPEPDEDEFYLTDLIGLEVRDASGATLGRVKSVPNFGAGDLLEITPATGGQTWFLAFTRDTVPELHIAGGWLLVAPPAEDETEVE